MKARGRQISYAVLSRTTIPELPARSVATVSTAPTRLSQIFYVLLGIEMLGIECGLEIFEDNFMDLIDRSIDRGVRDRNTFF